MQRVPCPDGWHSLVLSLLHWLGGAFHGLDCPSARCVCALEAGRQLLETLKRGIYRLLRLLGLAVQPGRRAWKALRLAKVPNLQ